MTKWRGLAVVITVVTLAEVILVGLGAWQWQRRAEKVAFLDGLRAGAATAPRVLVYKDARYGLAARADAEPADGPIPEFTRVLLRGRYFGSPVPVRATLAQPKSRDGFGGLGFWWITPLALDGGGIVLVNRGFVPARSDTGPPVLPMPEGTQIIVGYLRHPEMRGWFVPPDAPARGEFFVRDPRVLAQAVVLTDVAPFIVDAEQTPSATVAPVGINAQSWIERIPNNHLQYALTWWGLAVTLLGMAASFIWTRRRHGPADSAPIS